MAGLQRVAIVGEVLEHVVIPDRHDLNLLVVVDVVVIALLNATLVDDGEHRGHTDEGGTDQPQVERPAQGSLKVVAVGQLRQPSVPVAAEY